MLSILERIEKAKPIKKEILSKSIELIEKTMKMEDYDYQRKCKDSELLATKSHLTM